jgi:hypothetical protein
MLALLRVVYIFASLGWTETCVDGAVSWVARPNIIMSLDIMGLSNRGVSSILLLEAGKESSVMPAMANADIHSVANLGLMI